MARESLDKRLRELGPAKRFAPPRRGWIRALRDALGMTAADLAARMGTTGSSIRSMEEKEMTGGIRLSSLRRAAEAMDCTLVYAFIPNTSLSRTVERQARSVLNARLKQVGQTMALEDQAAQMPQSSIDEQLKSIIESGGLWADKG